MASKSVAEIIREGKMLKHCVGSQMYIKRHIKESGYILFLQETSTPDTPYVTIEYSDGHIWQKHGYDHSRPIFAAEKFLDTWLHKIAIPADNKNVNKAVAV